MAAKKSMENLRNEELSLYAQLESLVDAEQSYINLKSWHKVFDLLRFKQGIMHKINVVEILIKKKEYSDYKILDLKKIVERVMSKQKQNEQILLPFMSELKQELKGFNQQKRMKKMFPVPQAEDSSMFSVKY